MGEIANTRIPAEQVQMVNEKLFHWCEQCLHVVRQYFQHLSCVNCNSFQILSANRHVEASAKSESASQPVVHRLL
jgi:Zn finger protein HypA/HybF involved in hydrogenase expression